MLDLSELHRFIEDLVKKYAGQSCSTLNMLGDMQERYQYIPVEALYEMARVTGQSFADLQAIVSAFDSLTTDPVGKHLVLVCDGTACHATGSVDIIKALEDELGVRCGSTSEDGQYTLKSVYCVGACSLAPIVIMDGVSFGRIKLSRLENALKIIKEEEQ